MFFGGGLDDLPFREFSLGFLLLVLFLFDIWLKELGFSAIFSHEEVHLWAFLALLEQVVKPINDHRELLHEVSQIGLEVPILLFL